MRLILRDPTGVEGGGSPTPTPSPLPTPTPTPAPAQSSDDAWKALLAKKEGDATSIARQLFEENYKLRQKNAALKQGSAPKDGLALNAEQAKAWQAYQGLGKPEELASTLTEHKSLREEVEKGRKTTLYTAAATAHGYKASVLADLAAAKGLDIEVSESVVAGKKVPVAHVKHKGADGKDAITALPEYVTKHLGDYLPSLQIAGSQRTTAPAVAPGHNNPPPPDPTQPRSLSGLYSGQAF
jgi:hypothetical protein